MSANNRPQSMALAVVVANGDERRLLMGTDGALSTVRLVSQPFDSGWREAIDVNRAVREQIGLHCTLLRWLDMGQDPSTGEQTGVVLVESHDPEWTPGGNLTMAAPDASVEAVLKGRYPTADGEAIPWTQTGWFREASEWMCAQLEEIGLGIEGEVEQMRAWFLSCILRVETTGGPYYLKAVPPLFRHEPALTLDLSTRHAGFVPDVAAVDVERRWTLMRHVPGVKLIQHPDKPRYLPRWEAILRRYAQVQKEYARRVDDLLAMGCFDYRLDGLYSDVEALFAEITQLLEGTGRLSAEQIDTLRGYLPRLRAMRDTLAGSGLPATLHHGDFHSGNILCDQDCVVLDWSGHVGVAHPFLFLSVVSEEHTDEEVLDRLIEVYLSEWADYGSPDVLKEYARMGIVLGWLAGAVGHSRQIAMGDVAWDREQEQGNLEYCLQALLRLLGPG
ncbi:MAG: phosphotransferase family protein [Chloroflexia bacterium]